ncbi:MAG: dTMP kinase [Myxococcales bacterium]|nr:dTMP kinase [Myxococcales bacterium]
MNNAKLIVLEGVDGAGTTTHSRELSRGLRAAEVQVHTTAEPSTGPVGALLRQALMGRFVVSSASGSVRPPNWTTMALMFAADRVDHCESEILPQLRDGVSVICDRYYHSSVAYQSITGGGPEAIEWIRDLNRYARRPDLTLVLDVPSEVAAERRARRRGEEIYDAEPLQERLCEFYSDLERHFPGEPIEHVDAVGSVEEVAERILARVKRLG